MLPDGIIPLADYAMTFYTDRDSCAGLDYLINKFLEEHPTFYINLISPLAQTVGEVGTTGVLVIFEGPADEIKELRKEQ